MLASLPLIGRKREEEHPGSGRVRGTGRNTKNSAAVVECTCSNRGNISELDQEAGDGHHNEALTGTMNARLIFEKERICDQAINSGKSQMSLRRKKP